MVMSLKRHWMTAGAACECPTGRPPHALTGRDGGVGGHAITSGAALASVEQAVARRTRETAPPGYDANAAQNSVKSSLKT